jgi:hypothetical protein
MLPLLSEESKSHLLSLSRAKKLAFLILLYERMQGDEQRAFGRGSRLSLEILGELRLILRLVRFKKMDAAYEMAFGTLDDAPARMAAE